MVAIFAATDSNLQIVYALIVCTLCLLFQVSLSSSSVFNSCTSDTGTRLNFIPCCVHQAETQPYADDGDDLLGAVSSTCLAMTLTVGLGLAVPTADPNVRWMLEVLAIGVSVFAFLLGIYQFICDTWDEFNDNKDQADAAATKCCAGRKSGASKSRAAQDIAEVKGTACAS